MKKRTKPTCDRTFIDRKGRSWTFREVDAVDVADVKRQCDYWLPLILDDGIDCLTLVKVMGVLIGDQIESASVDEHEFLRGFGEETFTAAGKALSRAVLSFSHPARRELLSKVMDRMEVKEATAIKELSAATKKLTDKQIDSALKST